MTIVGLHGLALSTTLASFEIRTASVLGNPDHIPQSQLYTPILSTFEGPAFADCS